MTRITFISLQLFVNARWLFFKNVRIICLWTLKNSTIQILHSFCTIIDILLQQSLTYTQTTKKVWFISPFCEDESIYGCRGVQKHVSFREHPKLSLLVKWRKKILPSRKKLIKIAFHVNFRSVTSFGGFILPFPRNSWLNAQILMSVDFASVVSQRQFSPFR